MWVVALATWLLWQTLALATVLLRLGALGACVAAGVLLSAMGAQLLEHGVLASLHRSKWQRATSYDTLRRGFYRGYWLLALLYMLGAALWVYFTERSAARAAYGIFFVLLWEGGQLALAIALSSWDDVFARAKAALS